MAVDYSKYSEEAKADVLRENPREIMYMEDASEELQFIALGPYDSMWKSSSEWDCSILQYIKNPTQAVLEEAVSRKADSLRYIKNPSEELQLKAVRKYGGAIDYIENPTHDVIVFAITERTKKDRLDQNDLKLIAQIEDEESQIAIVQRHYTAIKGLTNPSYNVKLEAIKNNGLAIQYIDNPTNEMKWEAIKSNGLAIQYINKPTKEMKELAVKVSGDALEFIEKPSEEIIFDALKSDGTAIRFIEKPTEEMQLEAIKSRPCALKYFIADASEDVIIEALNNGYGYYSLSTDMRKVNREQTDRIKVAGMSKGDDLKYMQPLSEELQLEAIKKGYSAYVLKYCENSVTSKVILEAIKKGPNFVKYLGYSARNRIPEEAQLLIVENNPLDIRYIGKPTEKVQLKAVSKGDFLLQYIKKPTKAVIDYVNRVYNSDEKKVFTLDKHIVESLSAIFEELKPILRERGCTSSAELFEENGNIYLRWSKETIIADCSGWVEGIENAEGVRLKADVYYRRHLSGCIRRTIEALVKGQECKHWDVPFSIKSVSFSVSEGDFSKGLYRKSSEVGSYDIKLV